MMNKAASKIWSAKEREAWRLPEAITVSDWADKNRIVAYGPERGQWRTDRTPYLREPQDAFTDTEVEIIVFMTPPQMGKSSAIYNMIGCSVDIDPSDSMLVLPRDDKDIPYVVNKRLKPEMEKMPAVAKHLTGRVWDLSNSGFYFDNMTLEFAGSNSPADVKARSIRNLYLDDVDAYPSFMGKDVNPIEGAISRTDAYWDHKIVMASPPTTRYNYITIWWYKSNQQEYYIPCPRCGEYFWWKFSSLVYEDDNRDPTYIKEKGEVWLMCRHCRGRIDEWEKPSLVSRGRYVPEGQTIRPDGKLYGEPVQSKRISGYHFTQLLSPWKRWAEIMSLWFEANTAEGLLTGKLMVFNNTVDAVHWEKVGKKIDKDETKKRIGGFSRRTVPPECQLLVAGADYHESQKGIVRIDYGIRGFGYNETNWLIDYGSVTSFAELDRQVLLNPFPWADGTPNETRPFLAVIMLIVDSGYKPDEVYNYCIKRRGIALPSKGISTPQKNPLFFSSPEAAILKRLGFRNEKFKGMQLLNIDTSFFKDQTTTWLEMENGGTKYFTEIPDYYFKELTNEHRVEIADRYGHKQHEWKTVTEGAPTHSLDIEVLTAAAAMLKGVHYMTPAAERKTFIPAAVAQRLAARRPSPVRERKKGEGFLDNLPNL
jgi:phage terminase large subunit GpA-like protein